MLLTVYLYVFTLCFAPAFSDSKSSDEYIPCDRGWYFFRDKCYRAGGKKDSDAITWTRALTRCRNLGGNLVSIESEEEQDFIVTFLLLDIKRSAWTGLNDREKEDDYKWTDGSVYNYSKWHTNEPSNWIKGEECVELAFKPSESWMGQWNDANCELKRAYICEKTTNPRKSSPNPVYCSRDEGGGRKYQSSCYHVVTEEKTWQDAEIHCKYKYNGHLLTISDRIQDYFLERAMPDIKNKDMWIGIEIKNQLQQKWTSGWYVSYDGFNKKKKDLIEGTCIARKNIKEWKAVPCSTQLQFICEVSKENPPVLKKPPTGAHCPKDSDDWLDLGGEYCYYINTIKDVNHFEAQFDCNRRGGNLVSVHSQEENDFLLSFIRYTKQLIHIGLVKLYENHEEAFSWIDGSKLDYQNWDTGEPNKEEETCIVVDTQTMMWNDYPCITTGGHICSIKKIVPSDESSDCETFCIAPFTHLHEMLTQSSDAERILCKKS